MCVPVCLFESQSVFECKRVVFIIQILTMIHRGDKVVILSQILHVTRLNLLLGTTIQVISSIAESESTIFLFLTDLVSDRVLDELVDV